MASKTASHPVISLGLIPDGITKGLNAARNILNTGMKTLAAPFKTPLFGVALANQAAEFGQKINRLFLEPFRQLMAQEDLFSRFSVLAGGTDKAGKALDQFKGISRQTGISLTELSTSLDTLLQGQFSFAGAVAQIDDLSKVASVLGEGSLPMLTQAAAKFRSNAFVGFEDINQVAASGLPIFEALAQQIGITADEARGLARNGMITGLQARNALNGAAAMGAGANGGQQEQTLSGVVSRLREGLNQTLAEIGSAVSKVIDVPSLLSRFRGFLDGIRAFIAAAFGPLVDVVGKGNLQQAFDEARTATLSLLQAIGNGIIDMGTKLLVISNHLIDIYNRINAYFSGSDPEQGIRGFFNKLGQWEFDAGEWLAKKVGIDPGPNPFGPEAIQKAREEIFQPIQKFNVGGAEQMKANLGKVIDGARNQAAVNRAMAEAAMEADRQVENFDQAKGALEQFGQAFKNAMGDPFFTAIENLTKFEQLLLDAENQGVAMREQLLAENQNVSIGLMKPVLDFANQQAKVLQDARTNAVSTTGSAALVESIGKAQIGGQVQADVQNRIAQSLELQKQIQEETKRASIEAVGFLRQIANQPKGNPIGKI